MHRIQSILMITAAAFSVNMAYAQAPEGDPSNGGGQQIGTVATTNDPLIQKREDNAQANAQYKAHKKAYKAKYKDSKDEYKQRLAGAKLDQQQLKQDATKQEKASMSPAAATSPQDMQSTTKP